jgi:hypothetical protein
VLTSERAIAAKSDNLEPGSCGVQGGRDGEDGRSVRGDIG